MQFHSTRICGACFGLTALALALWLAVSWHAKHRHQQSHAAGAPSIADPGTAAGESPALLGHTTRQFIWDVEDLAFQFGKNVAPVLERALNETDTAAFAELCAPDFTAQLVDWSAGAAVRVGPCDAWGWGEQSARQSTSSAEEFARDILELRRQFEALQTAHVALKFLRPLEPGNARSAAWSATLQLELRGTCADGRRGEAVAEWELTTAAAPRDLHSLRHSVRSGTVRSAWRVRMRPDADHRLPLMEDVTDSCGFHASQFHDSWTTGRFESITGGVFVADYDRDGWLDFLVTDLSGYRLYRGAGDGQFQEVTIEAGLPTMALPAERGPNSLCALWVDLDGDGYVDLILGRRIFRNLGNGRFADVTRLSNFSPPDGMNNFSAADFDCDGRMDIYACTARPANEHPAQPQGWIDVHECQPNRLWRNLGNFQFADVTDSCGVGDRGRSFASVWFRWRADRYPDLFVINEIGQNALYVNEGAGAFRKIDIDGDRFGGFSMGVDVGDVDNDGIMDLYVSNMYSKAGNRMIANLSAADYPEGVYDKVRDFCTGNRLYRGRPDGGFDEVGPAAHAAAVGWAYGTRMVDLDGDGWLDLYAACGHQSISRHDPDG